MELIDFFFLFPTEASKSSSVHWVVPVICQNLKANYVASRK